MEHAQPLTSEKFIDMEKLNYDQDLFATEAAQTERSPLLGRGRRDADPELDIVSERDLIIALNLARLYLILAAVLYALEFFELLNIDYSYGFVLDFLYLLGLLDLFVVVGLCIQVWAHTSIHGTVTVSWA